MPSIEELDETPTQHTRQRGSRTPFAAWLATRLAGGVTGSDLLRQMGVWDHVDADLSDEQMQARLQLFATHPEFGPKACEVVRQRCHQLCQTPPFPFAVWLEERRLAGATSSQVLRMLGLVPSASVEESVTVLQDVQSQNRAQALLTQGVRGSVRRYDDDGDALIAFDDIDALQWIARQDFSKLAFAEPESRWRGLETFAEQESAWSVIAVMVPSRLRERPPRVHLVPIEGVEAVAQVIARSCRILVLAGAGISVACGLPTYRGDDLRPAIADEFGLQSAEDVSDIATFRKDPRPWFRWIQGVLPSAVRSLQPSLTHRFVKRLEERGKLLRMYTQNIDTLEQAAGITNVLHCHGSLATATCIQCGTRALDAKAVNEAIAAGAIPHCGACGEGVMKPDVVLFGEPMPPAVMQGLEEDTASTDLLLVLGTSLSVAPCSLVPSLVGTGDAPRVLINLERVGQATDFEGFLPGACDEVVASLLQHLGWEKEDLLL